MKLFSGLCIALAGSTAARWTGNSNELFRNENNRGTSRSGQYSYEQNRNELINNEQNQKSTGQYDGNRGPANRGPAYHGPANRGPAYHGPAYRGPANGGPDNRQFTQCAGFERCNLVCDQQYAQNRSFDSKSCSRQCFQENIMCDPEIQGAFDAMVDSVRNGGQFRADGHHGPQNQCMQQCQQQCQPQPRPQPRPTPGSRPWPPIEIENQPMRRSAKLVVNMARGAHSSGGPIHVFVDDKYVGAIKSPQDNIAHGGQRYELDIQPANGPGMIKLQASSQNGVHIDEIQYAGQTIMRNVWMDQDKDPKYRYCPCNRYDSQCTDSQHFRALQFQAQTKQVTGAVCASTGANGGNSGPNGGNVGPNGGNFQPNGGNSRPNGGNFGPNGSRPRGGSNPIGGFGPKSFDQYNSYN